MATGNSGTLTYQSVSPAWGSSGSQIKVDWSETYDVATNTSAVTFSNARLTIRGADGSTWITMLLKADGTNIINSDAFRGDFGGSTQSNVEKVMTPSGTWPRTITVQHDSDGTKSITVSASGMRVVNSGYGRNDRFADASETIALTAIPRASSFTVSGTTIGSAMAFAIQRAVSTFTHKLYCKYGSDDYALIADNVGTSYEWTIPESLGGKIPAAMSGTWTLKCETYSGTTLMGETVKTVTLTVPSYSLTGNGWCSAGYSNTGTAAAGINKPVKGYSKLTYSTDKTRVSTRYGATLNNPTVTANGSDVSGGQTITAINNTVSFRITDSRGKSLTEDVVITAFDYSSPTVTGVSAERCSSAGTADDEGMFWYAQATANISPIDGANTYTLMAAIKPAGGSYGAENALTSGAKSVFGGALSPTASYVVRITITDALNNSSQIEIQIPTSAVTFNARNGGRGFAFGKYAEADDLFDVEWDTRIRGDLNVDGEGNIAKISDFAYRAIEGSVAAVYDQFVPVVSTLLPAGYTYLVLATVDTNIDYDRAYVIRITGCDYTRTVRPNSQYGGGGMIYGFVAPKTSATTVAVEYYASYNTAQNARATMVVLRLPKMSSF